MKLIKMQSIGRVARYEDIAKDPRSQSEELLEYFGFQMHPNIETFLESHTKKDQKKRQEWSTVRDSKSGVQFNRHLKFKA